MADVNAVKAVIDSYLKAYSTRDVDALTNLMANDDNLIAFGTDAGEAWYGWKSFKEATEHLFAAIKEISWKRGKSKINFSTDGKVAWYAEEMSGYFISAGEKHTCNFRLTAVMENRANHWVITQFHRSVPVEGYAVPYLNIHGVRFD